ncbi:hypothetical protein EJB05_18580, partial [Eragrostis curvula]
MDDHQHHEMIETRLLWSELARRPVCYGYSCVAVVCLLQKAMAITTRAVDRNGDGEQKKRKQGGFKTLPFILGK